MWPSQRGHLLARRAVERAACVTKNNCETIWLRLINGHTLFFPSQKQTTVYPLARMSPTKNGA